MKSEGEDSTAQEAERLFQRYGLGLKAFLLTHLRNEDDAEEILQQTFLKLKTYLSELRAEDPEAKVGSSWLYRVAMNEAALRKRKERRQGSHQVRLGQFQSQLKSGESDQLIQEEERQAVQEALGSLPEAIRAVMELRIREDLKFEEIAAQLGVPIGTVASRMARGLKQLSGALKHLREHG